LKSAFSNYTVLIVLVALMGLFSMAAFSIQSRQKEIGIRKILGASGKEILLLLNKPFLKTAIIAILVATPIAWYFSSQWLQTFAYKVELQAWYFALGAGVSLIIAFVTVSVQAIKATYSNPVETLHED
jgi:putative ABC transport system permease protein